MKKIAMLVGVTILTSLFLGGCSEKPQEEVAQTEGNESAADDSADAKTDESGDASTVTIDIENYGVITVELDKEAAPITVDNFLELVNSGFYDGLTFHRIIDGFMMQGGDPEGTGMGGATETIKGEFLNNGVDNQLKHTKGAISMARSLEPDSASSQFFIVDEDAAMLDGDYAVFGYVTEGIDIVDKICAEAVVVDNNGTVEPANQPVIKTIKVIN